MFIQDIKVNSELLAEYNKRIGDTVAELRVKQPDFYPEYAPLTEKTAMYNFCPYNRFMEMVAKEGIKYVPDSSSSQSDAGFPFVYVGDCNNHYDLEEYTNYREVRNSRYDFEFGVCDNATQVLERMMELDLLGYFDHDKKYFVNLMPIIRQQQPQTGGWRWHKWGEYIGVQNSCCEYIYDEKDIDLVFCYSFCAVEDNDKKAVSNE